MSAENSYSIATANVLDKPTLKQAISWGVSEHINIAQSNGYDRIEVWPQGPRIIRQIRSGLNIDQLNGISSAHQSARDSLRLSYSKGNNILREIQKIPFLPETNSSFGDLERLGEQFESIGLELPVVIYKETEKYLAETRLIERRIQTDPETATLWGAQNAQEYVNQVLERGYQSIVIDTHHIRRSDNITGKNPLSDWRNSIPILLPYVKEIHIGVGRTDYGKMNREKIMEELDDLLNGGDKDTELIQMLRYIADLGWKGLIVVELRPSAVKQLTGTFSENDLSSTYARIRETLFQIFDT